MTPEVASDVAAVYFGRPSPGVCQLVALGLARRRPHRSQTKHLNWMKRGLRRALVHDAGCSDEGCRYHVTSFLCGDLTYIPAWLERTDGRMVSVPRSLRPALGRWLGGRS